MAKFYADLTDELQAFIAQQHLFSTATTPKEGRSGERNSLIDWATKKEMTGCGNIGNRRIKSVWMGYPLAYSSFKDAQFCSAR